MEVNEPCLEVSSELYDEYNYTCHTSQPIIDNKNIISKFPFTLPPDPIAADGDGDFIVQRRASNQTYSTIEIEHSKSTSLSLVGLQIWRGALLLADWIIHNRKRFSEESIVLELAAGVGLTSIVVAMYSSVICTDVDKGNILEIIRCNVRKNKSITRHPVEVRELDFKSPCISQDIAIVLPKVKIILAADVIYDNDLTEEFVKTMQTLLRNPSKPTMFIALEKRYVFTVTDCDVSAPCYHYFLECVSRSPNIAIEEVSIDFPQYFQYNRAKELVLLKAYAKM